MDEEKVLRDMESGEEFTMTEFRAEYEQLKRDGETEAETFEDYVRNSTEKNGFCEWIDEIQHKCEWCGEWNLESEMKEEADLGWLCERCILAITSRGEELYLRY